MILEELKTTNSNVASGAISTDDNFFWRFFSHTHIIKVVLLKKLLLLLCLIVAN